MGHQNILRKLRNGRATIRLIWNALRRQIKNNSIVKFAVKSSKEDFYEYATQKERYIAVLLRLIPFSLVVLIIAVLLIKPSSNLLTKVVIYYIFCLVASLFFVLTHP